MTTDASFPVQDFLEALTSQLDRTQDALRLKAVNRPMTYAIRDFSLNLQVFVELDADGLVRFRSAGPNEAGASTVSIGFTTITRTMINENTVDLAESQGQSLDELGLAPQEQRQLERVGVRNADQLRRLSTESSEDAVAKFADVPVNRLRAALEAGRPSAHRLQPDDGAPPSGGPTESVRVPPGTRRLRLDGRNLGRLATTGAATLAGVGLAIVEAGADHAVIDLGSHEPRGRLDIRLGDGQTVSYQLGTADPVHQRGPAEPVHQRGMADPVYRPADPAPAGAAWEPT